MKIARVFLDTSLVAGFDGLASVARKHDVEWQAMGSDEVLVFINRRKTSFKLLTASKYLIYWRSTQRIPLEAIRNLPAAFVGKSFDFNKSIEKTLTENLKK